MMFDARAYHSNRSSLSQASFWRETAMIQEGSALAFQTACIYPCRVPKLSHMLLIGPVHCGLWREVSASKTERQTDVSVDNGLTTSWRNRYIFLRVSGQKSCGSSHISRASNPSKSSLELIVILSSCVKCVYILVSLFR